MNVPHGLHASTPDARFKKSRDHGGNAHCIKRRSWLLEAEMGDHMYPYVRVERARVVRRTQLYGSVPESTGTECPERPTWQDQIATQSNLGRRGGRYTRLSERQKAVANRGARLGEEKEKYLNRYAYVHSKESRRKIATYITRRFRLLQESPDDRTARLPDELVHSA
ncbi:hypothetical protein BJV74DRAFT_851104 [Russula compacta]|nr:hypothetical protein BJV74DRAFT_851104 [Russula compacta]